MYFEKKTKKECNGNKVIMMCYSGYVFQLKEISKEPLIPFQETQKIV